MRPSGSDWTFDRLLSRQKNFYHETIGENTRDDRRIISSFCFRNQDSEVEGDSNGDLQNPSPGSSEVQQALVTFWPKVTEEIKKITTVRVFVRFEFESKWLRIRPTGS